MPADLNVATTAVLVPHHELTIALRESIAAFKMAFWNYDLQAQLRWLENETEPDDRHLILLTGRDVVGYLRLTRRSVSESRYGPSIVGVSTVAVASKLQGRGLGRQLMHSANQAILSESKAVGTLCCASDKVLFYQKCGWVPARNIFVRADMPLRPFFRDDYVLTLGDAAGLEGVVRVAGKPF
jgi:predicted N-acetyltransferase YhbS